MDRKRKKSLFYKKTYPLKNRIGICTGDPEGIGLFVIQKTLNAIRPKKGFQFVIWTNEKSPSLKVKNFKVKTFKTSKEVLASPFESNEILEIRTKKNPSHYVKECGLFCLENKLSAMITGPLSKQTIFKAGFKEKGQTHILKNISQVDFVHMCFLGKHFNVVLLNDHVPLLENKISKKNLKNLIEELLILRKFLPLERRKKSIALLGLNPHSGEEGLIGLEEKIILKPLLSQFKKNEVEGPLCPDSAFLKKNWKKYSFYLSLYHDQGLIPFKMIHPQKGFVFSLGLPFLRTGVDHGTGVFLKKNQISSKSFNLALKKTLSFIEKKGF